MFAQWQSEGLPVQLIGVGKDSHMSSLGNWTNSNNAPVCSDTSPFPVWSNWGVSQRDLVVVKNIVLLLAATVVTINFLTDIIYVALDPRLRDSNQ